MFPLFTVAYTYRQQIQPGAGSADAGCPDAKSAGESARLTPWRHGTMVVAAANAESARMIAGGRLAQLPGGGAYRLGEVHAGIVIDLPAESTLAPA
jgi:hypothetical protein